MKEENDDTHDDHGGEGEHGHPQGEGHRRDWVPLLLGDRLALLVLRPARGNSLVLVLRIRMPGLTYQLSRVGVVVVAVAISRASSWVVLLLGMAGQQRWRRGEAFTFHKESSSKLGRL